MNVVVTSPNELRALIRGEIFDAIAELRKEVQPSLGGRAPLTRQEAAKFLGISLPTVDILINTEQIKAFRIGRSVRIGWGEIEKYLNEKGGNR